MANTTPHNPQLFHSGGLSMQYAERGNGKHALFAFHGFGRSHRDFNSFCQNLHDDFTIYSFDIFFHEATDIGNRKPDKEPLQPEELKAYFKDFMSFINADKAWLMGYSLGGRIALKMAELMPEKTGGLYLFAPDGLVVNAWYALLSFTAPGRSLFRFFINRNRLFLRFLDFVFRIGIITDKRRTFILAHVKSTEMQWQVYNVWTFLRNIEPKMNKLGAALSENGIPVDLFMGKYDRIIPVKNVRRLKKVFPELKVHILESGHVMLTPQVAKVIEDKGLFRLPG